MYNSQELYEIIERNALMLQFSNDATTALLCAFNQIAMVQKEYHEFASEVEKYKNNINIDFTGIFDEVKEIGKRLVINEYTLYMILFLALADVMRDHYDRSGINRSIFMNTLRDLKYQLDICFDLYGIWGHSAPTWQIGFLRCTTLAFGRLQFQFCKFNKTYNLDTCKLTPDSKVLFIHIPRTGERLDHARVVESYQLAAEYFTPFFVDEPVVFACNSWILYPKNLEFLSEGSNLRAFYDDFNIISVEEYQDYKETWRLFDKLYTGNPDEMPQDTSLRRAYVEMMKRGEKTGRALGVFIYGQPQS